MAKTKYPFIRRMSVAKLCGDRYPGNPRTVTESELAQLNQQIDEFGNLQPLTYNDRTKRLISGNQRVLLYAKRGDKMTDAWVVDLDEEKERLAVVALNNHAGVFDTESLKALTELINSTAENPEEAMRLSGFKPGELEAILASTQGPNNGPNRRQEAHKKLADRFLLPPFSVLDTRQGYWQDRKRLWLELGLRGERGRPSNLVGGGSLYDGSTEWAGYRGPKVGDGEEDTTGTSVFDPTLTETLYYWFCPRGGCIIDPFAGGSTRGVVAGYLGYKYTGIDLSEDQLKANRRQWGEMIAPVEGTRNAEQQAAQPDPIWICGDGRDVQTLLGKPPVADQFDFMFSCPPYANLEVYSDDPRDVSRLPYHEFLPAYRAIIANTLALLKPNRFACFVVGDLRDQRGFYCNFVSDTISAFQRAGAKLYNEMILVTAIGSLPIRAGRAFVAGRKVGKTHQNVLVFFKGDPAQIREVFPEDPVLNDLSTGTTDTDTGTAAPPEGAAVNNDWVTNAV